MVGIIFLNIRSDFGFGIITKKAVYAKWNFKEKGI
jgi:hypothetical protein